MISNLQSEKRNLANGMMSEFILKNDWLKNVKEIKISSSGGDSLEDLPSYSFKIYFVKKNVYSEEEESSFILELQNLFYLVKEDLDSDFLHHERGTDKYVISLPDIAKKLSLLVINNIW